jgi:2-polyprenyl-6-methoxyphenol hydroxylase-like FAD-dependent oxidoreductase
MLLEHDAPDDFKSLGIYMSYFTIPQLPGDENMATIYHAPGGKVLATRRDNPRTLQAYLMTTSNGEKLENALKGSALEQQDAFAETFQGIGWQSDRILEGMRSAKDFYAQVIGQVKMDSWSKGRVVLLGDAAFCPAPITGMGTSCALVGAYVLAGEIAKNCKEPSKDGILVALKEYDRQLRPFIDKAQAISPWYPRVGCPQTQWGIWAIHTVLWLVTTLRLDKLGSMLLSDDVGGWDIPIYAEFNAQE